MVNFEEYKNIITHKDTLFKSWWENLGKWKAPDKMNEGIWHRLRRTDWNVEEDSPTMETGVYEWIRKQIPTVKIINKYKK